ncbi:MAG: DNA polymerase I [Flavobacteriales bacterium]
MGKTGRDGKRLFLLDSYALIFRGYYAFIKNPRVNSKGLNTSAILGFTNTLIDLLKREKPTHIAAVFDVGGETIRHREYPEYKAHREETPEAIRAAVPYIQEILKAFRIPVLFAEGYEADDVIGTLAKKAEIQGYTVYMMTADKDFAQLISDKIFMYRPAGRGSDIEIWDIPKVQRKFGVARPDQIVDFLGMMGDSVDNIPGLPGVGEKTAKRFMAEYGSMENLFAHAAALKGKVGEKIRAHEAQGLRSKRLATIITDVPISFDEKRLAADVPDLERIKAIFKDLEFRRTWETVWRAFGTVDEAGEQISLFGVAPKTAGVPPPTAAQPNGYHTHQTADHWYQTVAGKQGRKLLIQNLLKQSVVCLDTETTGLNALQAELVGLAFSYAPGKGYYVVFPEDFDETRGILAEFKPFFESAKIVKVAHNFKYDLKVLHKYGVQITGSLFDTMVAHYLINPDMRHNMDILAETYLNYKPIEIEHLIGKRGRDQKSMREVAVQLQTEYAVEDTDITLRLKNRFEPELKKIQVEKLFYEVEMPLVNALKAMEVAGIKIDTTALQHLSQALHADMQQVEAQIYEYAEGMFNIASPKQLGSVLFEKLKLSEKPKKTKTGQYATSEDVLNKLSGRHPIVDEILNYRQLQKLQTTYVDALPREVDKKTGRIHTVYSQTTAATGRLSSNKPNLQNIPIRSPRGREIRRAFVPRDEDHVLLSADYSQIELRLIAAMSRDPVMIESFEKGEDIHVATAAKVFEVDLKAVTRAQRSQAKTINFGIVYGVSAFGLSAQTELSRSEAKRLIDAYYDTYPTLKDFLSTQVERARQQGYVETLLGRRRYLKDIHANNSVVRRHAERNAVNAPVQGSAADIIKVAMNRIFQRFNKLQIQSKMLLQVHDELVFDVQREELPVVKALVKDEMAHAFPLAVPLVVDLGVGDNWLEAHWA